MEYAILIPQVATLVISVRIVQVPREAIVLVAEGHGFVTHAIKQHCSDLTTIDTDRTSIHGLRRTVHFLVRLDNRANVLVRNGLLFASSTTVNDYDNASHIEFLATRENTQRVLT